MNYKHAIVFCLSLVLLSFGLPKNIQKRVEKEVEKTFNTQVFELVKVNIDSEFLKDLPSAFEDNNLFEIQDKNSLLGYAYISSAPSKTAEFDYLVLFDKEWIIVKSKVLIYREEYGGEIGSKRWLKQFIGKDTSDELTYGDNIIAISGATISVRSMTNAVNNVLKSIKLLKHKNQL